MRTSLLIAPAALGLAFVAPGSGSVSSDAPKRPVTCAGETTLGSPKVAYAAVVRRHAVAFRAPGRNAFHRFGRRNINGLRTVFSIRKIVRDKACRVTWYRVQLPIKPNGIKGYIRSRSVDVGFVRTRLLVDLSARRLTLFRSGRRVLRAPVSIGSPSTPTPRGRYYVNQRMIAGNPRGPFGPSALGISAFSPVLTSWTQGGPIAVHGTNRPDLIGQAVSTGCIRVRNSVMRRLFRAVPAGTPVRIRA